MQVSVSSRNLMSSELASFLDAALRWSLEVIRHASKRFDVSVRPIANRLENHRAALAVNDYRIRVEAKLFGKAHGLASTCPEDTRGLSLRRDFCHGIYRWY